MPNLVHLPSHDEDGSLRVVVETPRGARCKIAYDPAVQIFTYARPLCLGLAYPYDWGFIPSTVADDGDPLDAMVYHEEHTWPGVVIAVKAIGVVRVVQKDKGEDWERNDRVITVPVGEKRWSDATRLEKRVREELEQFFVMVSEMTGKKVRVEGWEGPRPAKDVVNRAVKLFEKGKKR